MSAMPNSRSRAALSGNRGSAMFLLLLLALVLAFVMAGVYAFIANTANLERRSNVRLESTYAAEYAFEQAYQSLNQVLGQGTGIPDITRTTALTNLTTAPTSVFGTADGYTWKAYLTVPVQDGAVVGAIDTSTAPAQGVYKFLTIVEFDRVVPPMKNALHMHFQREWDYAQTPLFQYAIFYDRNMELFPGAAFSVNGKVHSNGTIYTGTTASIAFNDQVTSVNSVVNDYNPQDPRYNPKQRANLNAPSYNDGPATRTSAIYPPGETTANTSDANHNNDGPRELIEIPDSHSTDPSSTERMFNKAGIKILVNTTSSSATDTGDSGVSVPANTKQIYSADGTPIPSSDPLYTYLSNIVSNGTGSTYQFQDYRENAQMTTTNVDVGALNTAYNNGGLPATIPNASKWPSGTALAGSNIDPSLRGKPLWNGILYVADVSNSNSKTSPHRTGLKILNGTNLPSGAGTKGSAAVAGLTIATNNPAFVIGDYNTGGSPPTDGTGSNAASGNNYASGYTVQPAAIMADAVTVVSSNWISGKYDTQSSLSKRPATNTTINAALISGIVSSDGTDYSGGVENYIRLLEDWSGGNRLTYYGSMINLYDSKQSTSPWKQTGNYYNAPSRNWYFDRQFLDPNRLPPGTPLLRSLMRGQWVQVE